MHIHARAAAILALASTLALAACTPNPADDVPAAGITESSGQSNSANGSDAASAPVDSSASSGATVPDASGAYPGGAGPSAGVDAATGADPADPGYPGPGAESGKAEGSTGSAAVSGNPIALAGTIGLLASKVTRTHNIVFQNWTGTLDPGAGTPETAKLSFEVDTASVISDPDERGMMSDRLDKHLKSEDFFDVEKFPTATFASTSIVEGGENGATHTITGDLTVRDTTKTITFPANVTIDGSQISATAEFSLNRQDFGLVYPGQPDDLVRDEVVMKIDVTGTLAEES